MNIYSIILLGTALLNGFLAIYALLRYKTALTLSYAGVMLSFSLYSFGYAFELNSVTVESMLYWLRIQYIGIPFFPSFFLLYTLRFTGKEKWITGRLHVFLFTFSSLTLLIQFINPAQLFYTHFDLQQSGNLFLANFDKGIWYWMLQIFTNLIILICILFYFRMLFVEKRIEHRIRAFLMFIASFIPWPVYLLYLSGGSPGGIDLNPFSFTFLGLFFTISLFRYHLLDFVPIALENVFESLKDGVILLNYKNQIESYNKSATAIFPELSPNTIGKDCDVVFKSHPQLLSLFKENPNSSTEFISCTDKYQEFYKAEISQVVDNRNHCIGQTLIFTNITDLKRYANKLVKLNATKDKFFAIIAHDLRNPFNALNNLSDIIIEKINNNEKDDAIQIAGLIRESSYSAYNLLQNLLEWSNIQRDRIWYNPEHLQIAQLIEHEIDPLRNIARQKEIEIKTNIHDSMYVFADKNMLMTIVRNLVSNAVKYSYRGSSIDIISTWEEDKAVVSVVDKGTGMNKAEVEALFNSTETKSKKGTGQESGTGLGLILCKEFVELNKGEIWVNSKPNEGSTFSFSIPLSRQ